MPKAALAAALAALTLSAAIFGFFYAWTVSTMWGLDAADPRLAIGAMQAMNASVRNAAFAPAFFGTGPALLLAAGLSLAAGARRATMLFALAGVVYAVLGMGLTMAINVPMNQALAATAIPADPEAAATIWRGYSQPWQMWNQIRTLTSGLAFLLGLSGLIALIGAGQRQLP